ncbi:hypothetical protein Tco_0006759 [Tanacetum coccineum]
MADYQDWKERDDLKELYRLMMLKYGDNRPEEEFEMGFMGGLRTMFDPPYEEDAIWKLPHQQQILNRRYFHSCSVHCLTMEAAHIYMLTEVKYPYRPNYAKKAMLEKKLLGDRKDESWLAYKVMACGKGCGKSIYMVDSLPKTGCQCVPGLFKCSERDMTCRCEVLAMMFKRLMLQISLVMISRVADRSQEPVYTGKSSSFAVQE